MQSSIEHFRFVLGIRISKDGSQDKAVIFMSKVLDRRTSQDRHREEQF